VATLKKKRKLSPRKLQGVLREKSKRLSLNDPQPSSADVEKRGETGPVIILTKCFFELNRGEPEKKSTAGRESSDLFSQKKGGEVLRYNK